MGIGKWNGLRAGTVGQVGAHRSEAVSWGEKQSAIAADALRSEFSLMDEEKRKQLTAAVIADFWNTIGRRCTD